jgi:hypothetical protein
MQAENIPPEVKDHFHALGGYLEEHISNGILHWFYLVHKFNIRYTTETGTGISAQRQSAREKLTKLNTSQFHELSTDVYDEMNRRINNSDNGTTGCSSLQKLIGLNLHPI